MPSIFDSLSSIESIRSLIESATRESEVLEFKAASRPFSDSEKGEIAKDVSAMANSLGGTIVYGISTDSTDKTRASGIDAIHPKNIETFDRVLNAQVRPPIGGIRRKLVPVDTPQVMVVEIPPSEDSPHQSLYDKRYYRRSGSECLPMEHDLIALQFGRRHGPILGVAFHSIERPKPPRGKGLASGEGRVRVLIKNEGRRLGRHAHLLLVYPPRELARVADRAGSLRLIDQLYPGRQAHEFEQAHTVFHSGMFRSVAEIGISVEENFWNAPEDDALINWVLYADEMPRREGSVSLKELGWKA
jgi:hypothetical protein